MTKPFSSWDYDDAANAVQAKLALLDMRPDFATVNFRNDGLVHAMLTGQPRLRAAFTFSKFLLNSPHLLICQLRDAVIFSAWGQANFKGVFGVMGKCYPFQVLYSVISFYSINMISVVSGWFWTNESSKYQRMNRVTPLLRAETKSDIGIAARREKWFGYISRLRAARREFSFDSAEVRYGINSCIPADNRAPFFRFKFFSGKVVDRQSVNLLHRFVWSLGWGSVNTLPLPS